MNKKTRMKLVALICLLVLLTAMSVGCGGTKPESGAETAPAAEVSEEASEPEPAVFFHIYGENLTDVSEGVTHVWTFHKDMSEAWSFDTDHYPLTELCEPFDIGESDNGYYIEAGGTVYCLNKADGSVLWKLSDSSGSVSASKFDDEGNLYVCGYYGPALCVISPDGEVLHRYKNVTFTNSEEDPADFYWPTDLRLEDGRVKIHFDSNDRTVLMDPSTGEAELLPPGTGADLASAIPELEKLMGGWGSLDCRTSDDSDSVAIAEVTDENGKLKVDFAEITGGGSCVVFDEDDISFDGDVMTCVNGLVVMEGVNYLDGKLVVSPSPERDGGYTFVVSNESSDLIKDRSNSYIYTKVGNTHSELEDWIDANHEPI